MSRRFGGSHILRVGGGPTLMRGLPGRRATRGTAPAARYARYESPEVDAPPDDDQADELPPQDGLGAARRARFDLFQVG